MNASNVLAVILCMFVMVLSGHTMWNLMWFLSSAQVPSENLTDHFQSLLVSIWINTSLIVLFGVQHSYIKTNQIGNYLSRYRITPAIARSIYIIFTSLTLQV